jgi:hypothetical protein
MKSVNSAVWTGDLNKVECCPPQPEVMWWLASDAVSTVSPLHTLGHSLFQRLMLVLSVNFTVNCQSRCFVIHIAAVLLLCYCKQYGMALLIGILLNIWMCHVSLIILIITDLHSLYFPPYFRHAVVTFNITDVGELIFSGQTVEVTVYENTQLIFPLCLQK